MKRYKRVTCGILASLLLLACPIRARATSVGAAVAVGSYAVSEILAALGVLAGTSAVAVLIGTWDDEDTYEAQGALNELGTYAQMVYNNARSDIEEVAEKYQAIEETLIALVTSAWGTTVTGIKALVSDLKPYLKSIYGWGYIGEQWLVPTVPDQEVWAKTSWSTLDFYALPTTPAVLVPFMANDSSYTLFLTVFTPSSYTDVANVQNWYFNNTLDIFGIYDASAKQLYFYKRDAASSSYASYSAYTYSAYLYENGTFKYNVSSTSYWQHTSCYCSPSVAGSLAFPVFGSVTDAEYYVSTGEALNTYTSGTVPMTVEGFNEDVAGLDVDVISDALDIPASDEIAASNLIAISDAYTSGSVTDICDTLTSSGLSVTATDIPADDSADVSLGDILEGVVALPGTLVDTISDWLTVEVEEEEAEEELTIPSMIAEKFPFCIPFDFIYLIETLSAERETPRFEIPIKIDYAFVNYEQVFVVDFEEWDGAVTTLRVMLDILFCACLISGTRALIKG